MDISSGFLIIGLLMTLTGAILIYKSLRAGPNDIIENHDGVRYFFSVPIIVNGGRKWILAALLVTAVLFAFLVTKTVYPNLLGGVFSG
jgi:hypothetical protein